MEVKFTKKALEHLEFWKKSGNKGIQEKIQLLIEDIMKHLLQELANLKP